MPIEFEFTATPELGPKAMRYLLWRRGGPVGPIAIILLPVLVAVMVANPEMRPFAYTVGGAVIMLFVLFLLAVAHRRRIRRRFFESTTDHTVRVLVDEAGIAVKKALPAAPHYRGMQLGEFGPGKKSFWFSTTGGTTSRCRPRPSRRMRSNSSPRRVKAGERRKN